MNGEAMKVMIVTVNEENRKQFIGAGHHNVAKTTRPQTWDLH